jgi:hypothetical protein
MTFLIKTLFLAEQSLESDSRKIQAGSIGLEKIITTAAHEIHFSAGSCE